VGDAVCESHIGKHIGTAEIKVSLIGDGKIQA
jgi:hypothetical protein